MTSLYRYFPFPDRAWLSLMSIRGQGRIRTIPDFLSIYGLSVLASFWDSYWLPGVWDGGLGDSWLLQESQQVIPLAHIFFQKYTQALSPPPRSACTFRGATWVGTRAWVSLSMVNFEKSFRSAFR